MRALAFEHLRPNPIGVYGDVLDARGIGVDRIMLDEGEAIPDWRAYDFLVVMGAGVNEWDHDEHPWIAAERETVREAVLAGVPYFGVCFGAQLLGAALGAHSYRGVEAELGIIQVFLTAAARHDPVFRGFPPDLEVCQWHSNHFALPSGAIRLARSPRYENQAIRFGRVAYGIQCHLETSREDLEAWLELFPQTVGLFESRHGAGSLATFLDDYGAFVPRLRETARQLFGRWLENALALGNRAGAARALRAAQPRAVEPARGLIGRDGERARILRALTTARQGGSAVIVVRGDAGAGKTALLDDAVARARGLTVLRTRGGDREGEQHFAALPELCEPLVGRLARVPAARAAALASALGLGAAPRAVGRFAVYAGMLDLLTTAAEAETPLLVVVDDAHLLDEASAEAISFIARRLRIDGIALVIATEADGGFSDAEELRLGPLDSEHSRAVLAARFGGELAAQVVERIVHSGQGNPLALVEIARGLTPQQRCADAPLDGSLPPSAEWAYLRRIEALPPDTRRALLLAALADRGKRETVARACGIVGLDPTALDPAERVGLIEQDTTRVTFCHELARTAVSYSALSAERRLAHGALADAVEGERRLWHQANAAGGRDDAVADGLESVAMRARDRSAYAVAAHAFERAARLTSDPDGRAERLLHAARSGHLAGNVHAALDHLGAALECASAPPLRIALQHTRGRIAARSGDAARARDWLEATAARCEHDEPAKAAEILADAVLPSLRAGSPADAVRLARRSMRLAQDADDRVKLVATLLLGTALVFAGDYDEGVALIDDADVATANDGAGGSQPHPYLGAALAIAGRRARAREVLGQLIAAARDAGEADMLPYALVRLAGVELDSGRWRVAAAALAEAVQLAQETGNSADHGLALGTLAWLEAAQGHAEACRAHVEEALELAGRFGSGSRLDRAAHALALLELGCGRPESAIAPLQEVWQLQQETGWSDAALTPHRLPDLVEAYALAGRVREAHHALDRFSLEAERTRRPSAVALVARCRALLAPDSELDARFADALGRPGVESTGPFEVARTELLYGSRLARAGRSTDATDQLVAALRVFEELGAEPWAQRAREVIVAAGGTAPAPQLDRVERLTPLELDVALAAGSGAPLDDIAHRLFLGPRTARLLQASAMAKLGVESTAELAAALGPERSLHAPLSRHATA